MIIEFAVTNFRSIKDRQVMDFKIDGQIGNKTLSDQIALPKDRSYGNSLVKTTAIYGITNIYTPRLDTSQLSFPEEMTEEEKSKILERLKKRIKTVHAIYENGVEIGKTDFDLSEESTGTLKLVGLAGIVVQA